MSPGAGLLRELEAVVVSNVLLCGVMGDFGQKLFNKWRMDGITSTGIYINNRKGREM
jgi:hypothetical protein